jgi:archaellum component FlaC
MVDLLSAGPFRFRNMSQFFIDSYQSLSFVYDGLILATIFIFLFGETAKRVHLLGKDEKASHKLGVVIAVVFAFLIDLYIHQRGFKLADATPILILAMVGVGSYFLWKLIDHGITAMNKGETNRGLSIAAGLLIFNFLTSMLISTRFLGGGPGFWVFFYEIQVWIYLILFIAVGIGLLKFAYTRIGEERGTASSDRVRRRIDVAAEGLEKAGRWVWNGLVGAKDKVAAVAERAIRAGQTAGRLRNTLLSIIEKYTGHNDWILDTQKGILTLIAAGQKPTDKDIVRVNSLFAEATTFKDSVTSQVQALKTDCKNINETFDKLDNDIRKIEGDLDGAKSAYGHLDEQAKLLEPKIKHDYVNDPQGQALLSSLEDARNQLGVLKLQLDLVANPLKSARDQLHLHQPLGAELDARDFQDYLKRLTDLPSNLPPITRLIVTDRSISTNWQSLGGLYYEAKEAAQQLNERLAHIENGVTTDNARIIDIQKGITAAQQQWTALQEKQKTASQRVSDVQAKVAAHEEGKKIESRGKEAWGTTISLLRNTKSQWTRVESAWADLGRAVERATTIGGAKALKNAYLGDFTPAVSKVKESLARIDRAAVSNYLAYLLEQEKIGMRPATRPLVEKLVQLLPLFIEEETELHDAALALSTKINEIVDRATDAKTPNNELLDATHINELRTAYNNLSNLLRGKLEQTEKSIEKVVDEYETLVRG